MKYMATLGGSGGGEILYRKMDIYILANPHKQWKWAFLKVLDQIFTLYAYVFKLS